MKDLKNINTESSFENRTGLIVWLKSKRNVRRLMNFGVLHYVSRKMDYAILYVVTDNLEQVMDRLQQENFVQSIEVSQLKDLPLKYDDVLENLKKAIEDKKHQQKTEIFKKENEIDSL